MSTINDASDQSTAVISDSVEAKQSTSRVAAGSTGKALAYVYVGYAFRVLYPLVLVPFYARILGAVEYGRLLAALSLCQVVFLLTEYGFPLSGARDVAAADRSGLGEIYGRHVMGRVVLSVVGVCIGIGGTFWSPLLSERPLFGLAATFQGVLLAFNMGWFFQGTMQFKFMVGLEIAGFACALPIILLFVREPDDGWVVLAAMVGTNLLATVVAHAAVVRSIRGIVLRWRDGIALVRESTALFAHKAFTLIMASSSTYVLSLLASAEQVGLYGAAERIASLGLGLMQPANQVLVGAVSRNIGKEKTRAEAFALVRRGLVVMMAFAVSALVGDLLLSSFVVPLVLGPEFVRSVTILQTLGLLFPFSAFSQVMLGYVLIPLRFDRAVSRISLACAVVTFVLLVSLAGQLGGLGVAVARVLGYMVMAALVFGVLKREGLIRELLDGEWFTFGRK